MTVDPLAMTPQLHQYMLSVSLREPEVLVKMRREVEQMPNAGMLLAPEQGQFLAFLMKLIGAKYTLEVGVFTGCSTLWVADALPENGRIIACDVSETYTAIAQRYWQEAGVDHKIDLKLAPAGETLAALIEDGQSEQFDFAFIDADKNNYALYYEQCLTLLRPGGFIAVDNVLWSGRVVDETAQDEDTVAIRALNLKAKTDERVDISLVPIGDGLLLIRKR